MNSLTPFEQLKKDNQALANRIANAESVKDWEASMVMKKTFYNNKLLMIEMLESKDKKQTITARQHMQNVKDKPTVMRYKTGLYWLDEHLVDEDKNVGIEVGSYVVIAGKSGGGKTTVILDILANVSSYEKCVLFNFEMGDKRISKRFAKLLTKDVQFDNLLVNSTSRLLSEVTGEIRLLANDGIKFFVIDSRMKITVKSKDPEYLKISQISKELSELSATLDIIILIVNQIGEEDQKSGRRAFKGSGDQMYDTDIAWFIEVNKDTGRRTLVCPKNRQDETYYEADIPMKPEVTYYAE